MAVTAAIELLLALIDRAGAISALITKAKAEGRDDLTIEEWASILAADDAARASLEANIKAHGG